MSGRSDGPETPRGGAVDDAWLRAIDEHYRPDALDAAGRTRFDARLQERLASSGSRGPFGARAILAAPLVAAAALAWFLWAPAPGTAASDPDVVAWEWELLLGSEWTEEPAGAAPLPDEYVAIASAFLIE